MHLLISSVAHGRKRIELVSEAGTSRVLADDYSPMSEDIERLVFERAELEAWPLVSWEVADLMANARYVTEVVR